MTGPAGELMQLYQSQFSALVSHLQRLLGDRQSALDLSQQAGLKLLELTPEQRLSIREPRAFLFQIATNLARDQLRRRQTADVGQAELRRAEVTADPGPESLTSNLQQLAQLRRAIASLPDQARAVLLLARVEGLSHKEIATRLGLQPKTVENYMARAINLLRQRLAEIEHGH